MTLKEKFKEILKLELNADFERVIGKVVCEFNQVYNEVQVDLTHLIGAYFVEIKTDSFTEVKKLFINN